MRKYYEEPLFEELLLTDVLVESGDNTKDDEIKDDFDDEDELFEF